jgi:hypothetical protein
VNSEEFVHNPGCLAGVASASGQHRKPIGTGHGAMAGPPGPGRQHPVEDVVRLPPR